VTANDIRLALSKLLDREGKVAETQLMKWAEEQGIPWVKVEGQLRALKLRNLITDVMEADGRYWQQVVRQTAAPKSVPYGAYYVCDVVLELELPALAGGIGEDEGKLVFPRDGKGRIVLLPAWWKGMLKRVMERLATLEARIPKAVADHCDVLCPPLDVQPELVRLPVPDGRGVSVHEALPAGTQISLRCWMPGTHVPPSLARLVWETAGRVGFSPAKSKLGWGQFRLVEFRVSLGGVNSEAASA